MGVSHWKSAAARAKYEDAYRRSVALWRIPFEETSIPTTFGTTHVVVSGVADGSPIVLIHAASLTATQWYLQAQELGRTHRLFAVDIMGDIGLSTQSRTIRDREEAAAWLAEVIAGLGLHRPVVVGSSFGGFHGANLAALRHGSVGGLVLLGPAATVRPFSFLAKSFIRAGSLIPMPFTVRPGLRGMMDGGLPHEAIVRQMEVGVAGFRYDARGIFPTELPDAELASIRVPTLLLIGDHERIFDPSAALERARRLFPDIEAELLPGLGHLPGMQAPDVVNARIEAFLKKHGLAGHQPSVRELKRLPAEAINRPSVAVLA